MASLKKMTSPGSRKSATRTKPAPLARMMSGQHLDDQSTYHEGHEEEEDHDASQTSSDLSTAQGDDEKTWTEQDDIDRDDGREPVLERWTTNEFNDNDIEANREQPKLQPLKSTRTTNDPNEVYLDGPHENPKEWSRKKKWIATFVVSCFTFISPVSSSMVAPSLTEIAREFGIQNEVLVQMTLSIFVLAYALGPLFSRANE